MNEMDEQKDNPVIYVGEFEDVFQIDVLPFNGVFVI